MTELTSLKTLSDVEASDKTNLSIVFFLNRATEHIAIVTILKLPVNLGSPAIHCAQFTAAQLTAAFIQNILLRNWKTYQLSWASWQKP
jgi:hypothetical protein